MTKFQSKVYSKLGKRPKSARKIAEQLGYDRPQAVARALGSLWPNYARGGYGAGWTRAGV